MRSRLFVLFMVLALTLGTFGAALAQDAPMPFCGDLAAEDCALLQDSQAAMHNVASYNSAHSYTATLRGLPGLPSEEIVVTVDAGGAFSMDPDALAAAQDLEGRGSTEMRTVLTDSPEVVLNLVSGASADMVLEANVGPDLAAALSAQAGMTLPETLAVGLRLVDGVLYADLTEVAPLVQGLPAGWIGIPLAELLTAVQAQGGFELAAAQMDPAALQAAGVDPTAGAAALAVQTFFSNPETVSKFLSITRGDDTEVDGQAAAVFETSFDWVGFLTSQELQDLVLTLAKSGALGANAPSEADLQQGLQMLAMMGPTLFEGLTSDATQVIGLDDQYRYDYTSSVAWDLTGLLQMAAMSGQLPAELQPTSAEPLISLETAVTNSDMSTEATTDITAPEDAIVIPVEQLIGAPAE